METFRDDTVLQQIAHSAVRQLAIWVGFKESEDILHVVEALLEHPWWDGTHAADSSMGKCDACCAPLPCGAAGAWYCQACFVTQPLSRDPERLGPRPCHQEGNKSVVHLCSTCHEAFQDGNHSLHVAGHQFVPDPWSGDYFCAGDFCDCPTDRLLGRRMPSPAVVRQNQRQAAVGLPAGSVLGNQLVSVHSRRNRSRGGSSFLLTSASTCRWRS